MRNQEQILLLFPPVFYPHMPYIALPLLQAYLEKYCITTYQVDLNILAYQYFLNEKNLKTAYSKIKNRVKILSQEKIPPKLQFTSSPAMEYVINKSSEALEVVRGRNSSKMSPIKAEKVLELSLDIISDSFFPTQISFAGLRMPYSFKSSKEVYDAVYDKDVNMFIEFFKHIMPLVFEEHNFPLVGISINVPDQIIPAFTLCRIIRQLDRNVKIIIGGNIVTRLKDFFKNPNILSEFYDFCVYGEGELPLLKMLTQVSGQFISNRYFESECSINPNEVPCSNFTNLPLNDYFDRAIILPILASRRCYWDKCNFCSISAGYSPQYRRASARKVVDDIQLLQKRHNVSFFKFVDDAASPSLLENIADELIKRDIKIFWEAYTILEKQFASRNFCKKLYDSGCRWLYFGLETADQELAKNMNKRLINTPPQDILRTVKDAGICTHIWVIVGYPSDTRRRVDYTIEFIEKNRNFIDSVEVNQFALVRGAPILKNGLFEKYGIKQIINAKEDIALTFDYEIKNGMNQLEAKEITKQVRKYLENELGYVNVVRSTKLLSERFKIKNGGKHEEVID